MALSSVSNERTATLPDTRVHNVRDDIICCEAPSPNLNFTNIIFFTLDFGAKPPNLKPANVSCFYGLFSLVEVFLIYNFSVAQSI